MWVCVAREHRARCKRGVDDGAAGARLHNARVWWIGVGVGVGVGVCVGVWVLEGAGAGADLLEDAGLSEGSRESPPRGPAGAVQARVVVAV